MTDHPNAALVRNLLAGLDSGDEETLRSVFADDVVWHMIGGQTVVGFDELASAMGRAGGQFSIETEVHDVVGNEDHVVALVTATATAGDQTFTYRTAEIVHVVDGKVTERWAFSDDTQAINEFFSQFE